MDFRDMTIGEFAQGIAGENTIAGGGSVSALAGAYGAALVSMVCRKTLQNKKYADVYDHFQQLLADVQQPLETFLDGIQEDINAFTVFEQALALPKNTDEEKEVRKAAMQDGLKAAAMAPMAIAELAAGLMPACWDIVAKGNKNAASDALAGVLMMRAAVLGSVYNVRINLQSVKDEEYCARMLEKAAALEKTALEYEAKILAEATELTLIEK